MNPEIEYRYSSGLVIGKFYPPHAGHKLLIDKMASMCAHSTVVVLANSSEAIPVEKRVKWLKEIHPDVQVIGRIDDHPVDYDDPRIWQLWIDSIRESYPEGPEVVFTSEHYGTELAARLGAAHYMVDIDRKIMPVSGTIIRNNPYAYWPYLEPAVRAHYVKRICLVGGESTGKTTLAATLARYYDTSWVPEYGREYYTMKKYEQSDWNTQDFLNIVKGQLEREELAARAARYVLFCDTDPMTTSIWHQAYLGDWSDELIGIGRSKTYDLYVLVDTDIAWQQDGDRVSDTFRRNMQKTIIEELTARKVDYITVSGSIPQRVVQVERALEARFGLKREKRM